MKSRPTSTLLKGVPTNAQLAITLLRIGESNGAPLPPPPTSDFPPPDVAHEDAEYLEIEGWFDSLHEVEVEVD
jgi:hypothetical protein